ncbi:Molybdopterin adenylyltransferase [hydrothermal vent metagenome]|uniref:Molybdopterin adenylyltransferase n=1 Tax=hydrothermal vent metagenome TaxID=652676 RepID=A0A3B1BJP3_9ZZZZ
MKKLRVALLVVSDRASRGERADGCEPAIRGFLKRHGHKLGAVAIVPDEMEPIQKQLTEWTTGQGYDLALTAGGTGVSPRDITPEATRPLLERKIPGIPEAMRSASMEITPYAALSRGLAGFRGRSMILNLPGSPKAAVENLEVIFNTLIHAIAKAKGDKSDCAPLPTKHE